MASKSVSRSMSCTRPTVSPETLRQPQQTNAIFGGLCRQRSRSLPHLGHGSRYS